MEDPHTDDIRYERRRIAWRLHDSVGQTLSGLRMMLGSAADAGGTGVQMELLEGWAAVCDRALSELRGVVEDLHATDARDHSLEGALHRLVSEVGGDLGLRVEGEGAHLSAAGADALLLAGREGVVNARKHSDGGGVQIVLHFGEEAAVLRVRSSRGARQEGAGLRMGLGSMRQVVSRAGGRLETIQDHDQFELVATVPRSSERVVKPGG